MLMPGIFCLQYQINHTVMGYISIKPVMRGLCPAEFCRFRSICSDCKGCERGKTQIIEPLNERSVGGPPESMLHNCNFPVLKK
jgi:hypothetical protein